MHTHYNLMQHDVWQHGSLLPHSRLLDTAAESKTLQALQRKALQWHGSEVVVVALVAEFCCWLYPDTAADAHQGLMLHDTEEHLGVWRLAAVLWASRHSS